MNAVPNCDHWLTGAPDYDDSVTEDAIAAVAAKLTGGNDDENLVYEMIGALYCAKDALDYIASRIDMPRHLSADFRNLLSRAKWADRSVKAAAEAAA